MEQITSCIEDSLRTFIAHHLTTLSWSMKKLIIVAAFLHVSFFFIMEPCFWRVPHGPAAYQVQSVLHPIIDQRLNKLLDTVVIHQSPTLLGSDNACDRPTVHY